MHLLTTFCVFNFQHLPPVCVGVPKPLSVERTTTKTGGYVVPQIGTVSIFDVGRKNVNRLR